MLIKNRQLKRLVKICGDILRGYQFQCLVAYVDQAPATPEYKRLQLRHYLSGKALKATENLGHFSFTYESVKDPPGNKTS